MTKAGRDDTALGILEFLRNFARNSRFWNSRFTLKILDFRNSRFTLKILEFGILDFSLLVLLERHLR
ncbi:MAG: hypothetical protein SO039_01280, partial [Campylobacter sp.]|nr:hypothetical protein [Campylobacter sp.]